MFSLGYDRAFRCAVFLFSGTDNADEDFAAYKESLTQIVLAQDEPGPPMCGVLVIDPGNPMPNAYWRREIASVAKKFRAPCYLAIVCGSPLVRGVTTAIQWLAQPKYETSTHARFEDATAWLAERRGAKLPHFAALEAEARERAAAGERVPKSLAAIRKAPASAR